MKKQIPCLTVILVFMMSLTGIQMGHAQSKYVNFYDIRNSDNSIPDASDITFEYWVFDGMGSSVHVIGPNADASAFNDGMSGGILIINMNTYPGPINWRTGTGYLTIYLKVTNNDNGESNTFSGTLTDTYNTDWFTDDYTLPVELASFTARIEDMVVILEWKTHSETDNAGFNLYRSLDFESGFEKINTVLIQGAGNTSIEQIYHFKDVHVQEGQTYYYKIENVDRDGGSHMHGPIVIRFCTNNVQLPEEYELLQNHPNPFNPITKIQYNLPQVSDVRLCILNIQGKLVEELVNETQDAGFYTVKWNGKKSNAGSLPSGIYLYRLQTEYFSDIKKMFFIK